MKNKLNKVARDNNLYLKKFIKKQKKNRINHTHEVWFIFGRKKN